MERDLVTRLAKIPSRLRRHLAKNSPDDKINRQIYRSGILGYLEQQIENLEAVTGIEKDPVPPAKMTPGEIREFEEWYPRPVPKTPHQQLQEEEWARKRSLLIRLARIPAYLKQRAETGSSRSKRLTKDREQQLMRQFEYNSGEPGCLERLIKELENLLDAASPVQKA